MRHPITYTLYFLLLASQTFAQPTYNMSNQTVDDCKGFLLDSELGDLDGTYDHNENYTFFFFIPGVQEITLNFTSFCTELDFDYMRFFDGPDTLSAQIGPAYTGEPNPPPITAYSGCLTINFISDASVTCDGWNAWWCVEPIIPLAPEILPMANVPCESNTLTINFATPIPCDSITAGAFSISGPQSPNVISTEPSPCSGGLTTSVVLTLDSPIEASGDYVIQYISYYDDPCLEPVLLISNVDFSVVDCPLFVSLDAETNPICEGDCTLLTAEAFGGEVGTYSYSWSPALPNNPQVNICPDTTTTYSVTVSDALGATAETSIIVTVFPSPTIMPDCLSLCQSADPFFLSADPPGGTWSGEGISDDNTNTGYYDPSLVNGLSDVVTYTDPNGCNNEITINFLPLDEGSDDAACPGSAPFYVSGGLPAGGTWSGPNINPDGLFSPPADTGSFLVTYTHPNGCMGSKWIFVDTIVMPTLDSLCQSDAAFTLQVSPSGGLWSGSGITNPDTGTFNPSDANQGDNTLVYEINGCSDTITVFVNAINATYNFSACPDQAPFIVPGNWGPPGGTWSGPGIIDSLTGLFDPSLLDNWTNHVLTFEVNGCTDTRTAFIRQTTIFQDEPLIFCLGDDGITLEDDVVVDVAPCCGVWTGPGVQFQGGNIYSFDPNLAGVGAHILYYTRNTCTDSMEVIVDPNPQITPISICENENPVNLSGTTSGTWSGPGIVNETTGLFDPGVAGIGDHTIYLETINGCIGEEVINVFPMEIALIENIPPYYCYKDSSITIPVSPPGGALFVDGQPANSFNPALAGTGLHTIRYQIGAGECFSADSIFVEVGPELVALPVTDTDTLCFGHSTTITASASGGTGNDFTYTWNQGLGFGQTHFVTPSQGLTTYTVQIEDGCSDPATAPLPIWVHPEIQSIVETGEAVCFDDSTYAFITAFPEGSYQYLWDTTHNSGALGHVFSWVG